VSTGYARGGVTQAPGTARLITSPTDVHGRDRDGIELEMRAFQLWRVRDGKFHRSASRSLIRRARPGTASAIASPTSSHAATMYGKTSKGEAGAGTRLR